MLKLPDASVDAVVTDPPYELGFMGKGWDASGIAYDPKMWAQVLRVLKPGGHLLAFGGTRTYHRMACAVEDAGFEVRDSIHWIYGSGFPKSLDVSKAIDTRERTGGSSQKQRRQVAMGDAYEPHPLAGTPGYGSEGPLNHGGYGAFDRHAATELTPDAARWSGWGTALKPAHEPIIVARKPLAGTVAANVLAHGTGAINVDGCRVATADHLGGGAYSPGGRPADLPGATRSATAAGMLASGGGRLPAASYEQPAGRWPANVLLTHDPDCADTCADACPVAEMDGQSGVTTSPGKVTRGGKRSEAYGMGRQEGVACPSDTGGASRFFPVFRYCAKAPTKERPVGADGTKHPTVKPLDLMRWLVRLVTPPGGVVLDPFVGSGTTIEAALREGFDVIGCELTQAYVPLIRSRVARAREIG
jgi:hypothetical protein